MPSRVKGTWEFWYKAAKGKLAFNVLGWAGKRLVGEMDLKYFKGESTRVSQTIISQ